MGTLVVVLTALSLVGCEGVLYWHDYPKSQYRPLDMSRIKVGMTEDEVRKTLGESADIIGSLKDEEGRIVKVLQIYGSKVFLCYRPRPLEEKL